MCRKSFVLAVGNIKGEIMYFELRENKPHGTEDDPFSIYHIKNGGRSFQIPVHWHDELEIIYVKSGFLTVSISGENYIGTPGDAFVHKKHPMQPPWLFFHWCTSCCANHVLLLSESFEYIP